MRGRPVRGHYVEAGGARVLFDCGNGVLANLATLEDPVALDAVFITHNHIDHYADVFSLHAALRYAPEGPRGPMPLYLPAGLFERMKALLSAEVPPSSRRRSSRSSWRTASRSSWAACA